MSQETGDWLSIWVSDVIIFTSCWTLRQCCCNYKPFSMPLSHNWPLLSLIARNCTLTSISTSSFSQLPQWLPFFSAHPLSLVHCFHFLSGFPTGFFHPMTDGRKRSDTAMIGQKSSKCSHEMFLWIEYKTGVTYAMTLILRDKAL